MKMYITKINGKISLGETILAYCLLLIAMLIFIPLILLLGIAVWSSLFDIMSGV
jgi:hypothetical protein